MLTQSLSSFDTKIHIFTVDFAYQDPSSYNSTERKIIGPKATKDQNLGLRE